MKRTSRAILARAARLGWKIEASFIDNGGYKTTIVRFKKGDDEYIVDLLDGETITDAIRASVPHDSDLMVAVG